MGLAIMKDRKVAVVLKGATASELAEHIRNGYPQLLPDLANLTAVETPDDALPPVAPPDPPSPEEVAEKEAQTVQAEVVKKLTAIVLDFENRLRVLEGKETVEEIPVVSGKKVLVKP